VRLVLDEHASPRVAEQLREAGYDVVAAVEARLRQQPDEDVLRWAVRERRALVTRNVRDYRPLHARFLSRAEAHFGLIYVPRSNLLAEAAIGEPVGSLGRLLQRAASDDALLSQEHWLDVGST
jgi:hypothetical protein